MDTKDMNPYQRIVRDGTVIQPGHIDTRKKFEQLTQGLDLKDKSLIDVGCNLGEMCRLAKDAGAFDVKGIDIEAEYIYDARKLNPDITFEVRRAERAVGDWNILLASAMLHYSPNLQETLSQFARVAQEVRCDVWMNEFAQTDYPLFFDTKRRLFYPSWDLWEELAKEYFAKVEMLGPAESPDTSCRKIFKLTEPKPTPVTAQLFWGPSGKGKTSKARDLKNGKNYEHLELDSIFIEWRIVKQPSLELSVSNFVDDRYKMTREDIYEYINYHRKYLTTWLYARKNLNVVIDGYDMFYSEYRHMVLDVLHKVGWTKVLGEECK